MVLKSYKLEEIIYYSDPFIIVVYVCQFCKVNFRLDNLQLINCNSNYLKKEIIHKEKGKKEEIRQEQVIVGCKMKIQQTVSCYKFIMQIIAKV